MPAPRAAASDRANLEEVVTRARRSAGRNIHRRWCAWDATVSPAAQRAVLEVVHLSELDRQTRAHGRDQQNANGGEKAPATFEDLLRDLRRTHRNNDLVASLRVDGGREREAISRTDTVIVGEEHVEIIVVR